MKENCLQGSLLGYKIGSSLAFTCPSWHMISNKSMVLACHDKFVRLTFEKPISGKIVMGVHADKSLRLECFILFIHFLMYHPTPAATLATLL
jgi:hypothetical protein